MIQRAGVFLFLLIIGCDQGLQDEIAPKIDDFTFSSESVMPDEVFEVSVAVSDDEELNQLRLRIVDAFAKTYSPWNLLRIEDLSGRNFQRNYMFALPDSALAGYYSIALQVADERGNSSVDSIQYITVLRPGLNPELVDFQTTPPFDSENVIVADSLGYLIFSGLATDETNLARVDIEFKNRITNNLSADSYVFPADTVVTSWDFAENADTVFFESFNSLPVQMVVKLTDVDGHRTRKAYQMIFNP